MVVAVVQRGNLGINAALTLPGVQADTTTDNPCQNPACPPNPLRNYSIDGRDWRRTDAGSPSLLNPLKFGIATGSGMETTVENGFDDTYKRNYVQGKHEGTGAPTTGLNTIEYDTSPDALTPGPPRFRRSCPIWPRTPQPRSSRARRRVSSRPAAARATSRRGSA